MFYRSFGHDITSGNIGLTAVGSFVGEQFIVGAIETSPDTDHAANVQVTINGFNFSVDLYPAKKIPIVISLLTATGNVSYSTAVSGSDGQYSITLGS